MSKKYEMDMTTGVIMPKVITFALPLIVASVLQLLFNAADIVVVGRPDVKLPCSFVRRNVKRPGSCNRPNVGLPGAGFRQNIRLPGIYRRLPVASSGCSVDERPPSPVCSCRLDRGGASSR